MEGPRGSWHWNRPSLEELREKNIVTTELLKRGIDFIGKRSGAYDAWNEVKEGYHDFSDAAGAEYAKIKKSLKAAKKTSGLDEIPRKPGKRQKIPSAPPNTPNSAGSNSRHSSFSNFSGNEHMPYRRSGEFGPRNATDGTPAGKGTDGDEVPVMPVPRRIAKVVPNYFNINLPYESVISFNPSVFTRSNTTPVFRIRLNSIYDPIVGAASNTQPQGRDLWAAHFNYYRVLACDVKFTLMHSVPCDENGSVRYGHFLTGYELCDQDMSICDGLTSFMVSKHSKRKLMMPAQQMVYWNGTAAVNLPVKQGYITHSYSYDPNNWNFHVRNEGSESRWTPVAENPSVDHDLVARIFHLDGASPTDYAFAGACLINVNYQVQFMEEKEVAYKVRDSSLADYINENTTQADD